MLNSVGWSQVNSNELAWSAAPNGAPHLDPRSTYKLPEGGVASMGPTVSPTALSKFLTAVSGKQFQNPPSEMLASRGVAMHELLELFSGKPVPGRVRLLCIAFQPSAHCLSAFCALPSSLLCIALQHPQLIPFQSHQCLPGLWGLHAAGFAVQLHLYLQTSILTSCVCYGKSATHVLCSSFFCTVM